MTENHQEESGFTILEVLVALVILITGLAAFYFVMGSGLLGGASAERSWRAARAADNLLVQLGHSIPIDEGSRQGQLPGDIHWRLRLEPIAQDSDGQAASSPLTAYTATLDVDLGDANDNSYRVSTIVIAKRPR
jgi:prepilin-type N-terminal cleavage/methylation domain-containing protein